MKRAFRYCKASGCNKLTNDGTGYCPEHQGQRADRLKVTDPFYLSPRWRNLSKWYRNGHPLCELCGKPTFIVHHKVPIRADNGRIAEDDTLLMDETNLEALCVRCHEKKHERFKSRVYTY